VRGRGRALLLCAALAAAAACGGRRPPQELAAARALAASPLYAAARKLSPETWHAAEEALARAAAAAKKGDAQEARLASLEAQALFKTALVLADGKKAAARALEAKEKTAAHAAAAQKFSTLRRDAEKRFLKIVDYHFAQKDEAALMKSAFALDRGKFLALDEEGRAAWEAAHAPGLEKTLALAESYAAAAGLIVRACVAAGAQQQEAQEAIAAARAAKDGSWEARRPLVDDALLKAERLLVHARLLATPAPLENPAASDAAVALVKGATAGEALFFSSGLKGIALSAADPWDAGAGALSAAALSVVGKLGALVKGRTSVLLLVEAYAYPPQAKDAKAVSDAIAAAVMAALPVENAAGSGIAAVGRGAAPPPDPSSCVFAPCPGGRVDITIVNY